MNRRITKTMAQNAALKMAGKVYGEKLSSIQKALDAECEKLTRKYYPAPVLGCIQEFPAYFNKTRCVIITAHKVSPLFGHEPEIAGNLSFDVSVAARFIYVEPAEYRKVSTIKKSLNSVKTRRDSFKDSCYVTLCSLGTEKRVSESFPEALEFLDLPKSKALPSVNCDEIRQLLRIAK